MDRRERKKKRMKNQIMMWLSSDEGWPDYLLGVWQKKCPKKLCSQAAVSCSSMCNVWLGWIWVWFDRQAGLCMCNDAWVVHGYWWASWTVHGCWCMVIGGWWLIFPCMALLAHQSPFITFAVTAQPFHQTNPKSRHEHNTPKSYMILLLLGKI